MYSLPKDFSNKSVAILPIARFVLQFPFRIGPFYFFPPGTLDIISLNPVPPLNLEDCRNNSSYIDLEGNNLRRVKSSVAGLSIDILEENPLIVFVCDIDWVKYESMSHDDDIELIKTLSSIAERALDVIRFNYCQFDLPDTLPGLPGSWDNSDQFLGSLIYNPTKNVSHLISGGAVESTVVIKGIGLEVDAHPHLTWPDRNSGELNSIAIHALSLFSDVMYASNETTRYARAMTLLEFLGSPDEYKTWKKLKGEVICHIAKDKDDYLRLVERFKELTSKEDDNDVQTGLRTLIVHHGKYLHELVPDRKKRKMLFRELQKYAGCVLKDMLSNGDSSWSEFSIYRAKLKEKLGVA